MDKNDRTVYITNRGFHNYEKATTFGELKALTIGHVNLSATDRLEERIQFALKDANPTDYLLLSGAPIIGAIAQAHLMHRFGFVNLIFHDPAKGDYTVRKELDGSLKLIKPTAGSITCPSCGRVIAEASISAVASDVCDLCKAEAEELEDVSYG